MASGGSQRVINIKIRVVCTDAYDRVNTFPPEGFLVGHIYPAAP